MGLAKMNKAEFIKTCGLRGICNQQIATMYASRFADDKEYTETDFENAFRFNDRMSYFSGNRNMRSYDGAMSSKYFVNISSDKR